MRYRSTIGTGSCAVGRAQAEDPALLALGVRVATFAGDPCAHRIIMVPNGQTLGMLGHLGVNVPDLPAADLGELRPRHLAAGLRRMEIMAAAIGVEGAEQALRRHHLGEAAETRRRSLFLDQECRMDSERVASSRVTTKSSGGAPSSQACREASWCNSMPGIGRRGHLLRCAPRRGDGFTSPARCNCSLVTV